MGGPYSHKAERLRASGPGSMGEDIQITDEEPFALQAGQAPSLPQGPGKWRKSRTEDTSAILGPGPQWAFSGHFSLPPGSDTHEVIW